MGLKNYYYIEIMAPFLRGVQVYHDIVVCGPRLLKFSAESWGIQCKDYVIVFTFFCVCVSNKNCQTVVISCTAILFLFLCNRVCSGYNSLYLKQEITNAS